MSTGSTLSDAVQELVRRRQEMVQRQLVARGITDRQLLAAMGSVAREAFVPASLAEFAYDDSPLPIEAEQTISQPYIVALMAQALELSPNDRVLEIGAGSGYAAAVLSLISREVYAVERIGELAELARTHCRDLGYHNVHLLHADGTNGWPQHAPYEAIVVWAGGPSVPTALLDQLTIGGRLVIPVGDNPRLQTLVRIRRQEADRYEREDLGSVRFVPLIGDQGWKPKSVNPGLRTAATHGPSRHAVAALIREAAEPLDAIDDAELGPLLERIGDARVVLLGEATHGTAEFYRMRSRITRELITRKGFDLVAFEADWPDMAEVDRHVRRAPRRREEIFTRFPTWMWRNREFGELVHWLHEHNANIHDPARRVSLHGLDLYSMFTSIAAVLDYLDRVDPAAGVSARARYGCLTPWERDPAAYGRAALEGRYASCEPEVLATLVSMLECRLTYETHDGESFLDAEQNARVIATAERYYRVMYYGSAESWNLRDHHMFDTLERLLAFRGPHSKAVVWAHNSHVGNAAATEMTDRGQINIGLLAREHFGSKAFLVGFGTDHGTVAAARDWDGPMSIRQVRPAHPESYESLCHESTVPAFLLHLKEPVRADLTDELAVPRLERAIGVIYRPETELESHYLQVTLPYQFDEYVWFDETTAVTASGTTGESPHGGVPDTYPFRL